MRNNKKQIALDELLNNPLKTFRHIAREFLSDGKMKKMVSLKDQRKEIQLLKSSIAHERFFMVLDLAGCSLKQVTGVSKWLGYPDATYTLEKHVTLLHPSQQLARNMMAISLLKHYVEGGMPLKFMGHRIASQVAMRHRNGYYLLFNRVGMPFQYNDKNQLLEVLNEYTLIGPYHDTVYSSRTADEDGNPLKVQQQFEDALKKMFSKMEFFSVQELRIIQRIVRNPVITNAALGRAFKISENTVKEYNDRIKLKASKLFARKFISAREVALLLSNQGLV